MESFRPCAQDDKNRAMKIRQSTAEDFEALYRLDQACFTAEIAYSRRTLRAFLRLPNMMCLVSDATDGIAGFILTDHDGALGHVVTLDVAAAFRRRQLGSALLAAAEGRLAAQGVREMEIETATSNEAAIAFSYAILLESALSFLGLGAQPPEPSWGNMLNTGRGFMAQAPWLSIVPGMAIFLCVLGFNFIGDGLRDVLDPHLKD